MKLKDVVVGMQVVVKKGNFKGQTLIVERIIENIVPNVRLVTVGGDCAVWMDCKNIKPVKQTVYDIPQKSMLLREVVVTSGGSDVQTNCVGYISGVCHDGFILVELENFNKGHDGRHCDEELLCGWTGKDGDMNYWFFQEYELSYVNTDGSLTPVEEELP